MDNELGVPENFSIVWDAEGMLGAQSILAWNEQITELITEFLELVEGEREFDGLLVRMLHGHLNDGVAVFENTRAKLSFDTIRYFCQVMENAQRKTFNSVESWAVRP